MQPRPCRRFTGHIRDGRATLLEFSTRTKNRVFRTNSIHGPRDDLIHPIRLEAPMSTTHEIHQSEWSDPENWSDGAIKFYFCKRDSRVCVPKQQPWQG